MLRIGIAADSHGDWAALDAWADRKALDLVVHCGDCGAATAAGVPVWAARGNHDLALEPGEEERPRFVADYDAVEFGGLRWLFVGCRSLLGEVAPLPADLPAAGVLISHESPFNPHLGWTGHAVVRAVIERARPRWCFSGHWHHAAQAAIGPTACFALGSDPADWLVAEVEHGSLRLLKPAGRRMALAAVERDA